MRSWLLGLWLISTVAFAELPIEVRDAWVREAPPSASVNAGYLVLHNNSDQVQHLQHIQSEQFRAVEMHETIMEADVAKMREVRDLAIPAGGEVEFQSGGYHLMLMEPLIAIKAGAQVSVVLHFSSGLEIPIVMLVKKADDQTGDQSNEHHHHH